MEELQPTPFARYFRLRDPQRDDFRLDPDRDARLYVDMDSVMDQLERAFSGTAPQLVLEGDFGTGKSHILHYVEHVLEAPRFRPVYIQLSGFNKRSDFYTIHRALIGQLLPLARQMMQLPDGQRPDVKNLPSLGEDLKRALEGLGFTGISRPHGDAVAAEQWLSDSRLLTASRATKAGYAGTLREKASPSDLVELYKALSELYARAFGRRIVLLIDEGEAFSRVVDPDAQVHIGGGLRGLFDAENRSIGICLGLTTPRTRAGTHPMLRSDVRSRVGDRLIRLQPLNDPDRIHRFLERLWPELTTDASSSPFMLDRSAQNLVETRLDALRRCVFPDERLAPSPTHRDLLEVLSKIGRGAVENRASAPLAARLIERWFGL